MTLFENNMDVQPGLFNEVDTIDLRMYGDILNNARWNFDQFFGSPLHPVIHINFANNRIILPSGDNVFAVILYFNKDGKLWRRDVKTSTDNGDRHGRISIISDDRNTVGIGHFPPEILLPDSTLYKAKFFIRNGGK